MLPPDMSGNPEAIFEVVQLPTGEIIDAVLRKSSGVRAYEAPCSAQSRNRHRCRAPTGRAFSAYSDAQIQAAGLVSLTRGTARHARRQESMPSLRQIEAAEAQLHVALDNMPGALVYTDEDLNIVFCNDRFREMYPVPQDLLQPGRPYPDFLRHLAEQRLLRRRRRRGAGRDARGEPAQSDRQELRGPHAGRPVLRILPPQGGRRRHGDGDDRRHGAEAGRAGAGAARKPSSMSRSTTCRARSSTPTRS